MSINKVQNALWWLLALSLIGVGVWAYPLVKQRLLGAPAPVVAPAAPVNNLSVAQTAALIRTAEPSAKDSQGWATDLLNALKLHNLPQTRENVCSVIAVIDQESGFVANPAIPNLGKMAEKAINEKLRKLSILGNGAILFLNNFPSNQISFMQRIRNAHTERDLDLAYRDLIGGLGQYLHQHKMGLLLDNGIARDLIESNNDINTIGSMQVSVEFALQYEKEKNGGRTLSLEDIYKIRDSLYTRGGGLYYGVLLLLGYDSGYDKKLYRFADFNAGRYSSRNAAFQSVVGTLLGKPITTDGDLLMYKSDGDAALSSSGTEEAVRALSQKLNLNLGDYRIRLDLMQEKTLGFNDTTTYKTIMATYAKLKKVKPIYAVVPHIELHSEKSSRILTTEKYANTVYARYQKCIAQP